MFVLLALNFVTCTYNTGKTNNVNNVASACNTSNTVLIPPDWYTGTVLNADGSKTTLQDQLLALKKTISSEVQNQVFQQVFLNGTTN